MLTYADIVSLIADWPADAVSETSFRNAVAILCDIVGSK